MTPTGRVTRYSSSAIPDSRNAVMELGGNMIDYPLPVGYQNKVLH